MAAPAPESPASPLSGSAPKIGDSRPAPPFTPRFPPPAPGAKPAPVQAAPVPAPVSPGPPRRDATAPPPPGPAPASRSATEAAPNDAGSRAPAANGEAGSSGGPKKRRRRGGRGRGRGSGGGNKAQSTGHLAESPLGEVEEELSEQRRGRERKGRPVGRYLMCVHVAGQTTHIAVLEGRSLIEHYVSRPQDDVNQIDGNIYLGRVQNVLPGMEAAFIEIGTPKNAVLYRGDVRYDRDDVEGGDSQKDSKNKEARIEQLLRPGQSVLCQVTKNPIGHKGARLTQEVSLPGRFLVLVPNCDTYGISKRLPDNERKRLRRVLDEVRPPGHGLIVRTAADGATSDELRRDLSRLLAQWEEIDKQAKRTKAPAVLYCEPDMAVRIIREEFNRDYRGVIIDDLGLYNDVRAYVASISPELADRVEYFDRSADPLPLYERHHIHEQLHRALDRKVWLPSGGSLIIERTEALTVIDVNTGKNVGSSNLEETVYRNNLEAAEEVARQLRLRDIGGIIVIDFIDMEIVKNRNDVNRAFREFLARDKTRTQVFDISELGLVQMTRKRVSEGLVESFSSTCPTCNGRGMIIDEDLLSS
ncbi:MAG TPA: Rne/Rng family ribonuclease [Acidimicrobiales bacterium]|nr:Rne/Rng family ribonuclease [Acidimicrobiales bacterium]